MTTIAVLNASVAYLRTRWAHATLRDRPAIERHQARGFERTVRHARRRVAFYRELPPGAPPPVIDKAVQQARFADFNVGRVTLAEAVAAIEAGGDTVRGYRVGQSTGTSGNRGRFVISEAERFTWLGVILAKALPDAPWRRRRVALALPGLSSLYRSAREGSRVALGFFPLAEGVDAWLDRFVRFAPDAVVAPPRALRRLAGAGALGGVEAFSGGEVLDPLDRRVVEAATGRPLREIYMATEGLLGVGCPRGTLHLAEDAVRFEWEPVEGSALVAPVITDLVRRAQPMIRYRMNDLLDLDPRPCACGLALQPVRRVEGRMDDCLLVEGGDGRVRLVTPDVVRNAVVDADGRIDDFRVVQEGPRALRVALPAGLPRDADAAVAAALRRALEPFGRPDLALSIDRGIAEAPARKLRRVLRGRF